VTAHEVAHQWWGHQVVPGDVQGSSMLVETMAQYSALMVMKHEYGPEKMRRFLAYELDRYLVGRTFERKKEQPLARVEEQQYIHYRKGSIVLYALQDYIGEDNLNRALATFVGRVKFQQPPYTNTTELIAEIRKVTTPELQYLIDDLFEHITLYDNRALAATAKKDGAGYQVTVKVSAKKLRADALGVEEEVPMDDSVDVGALDEKGVVLYREKRRVRGGNSEITFTSPSLPAKAGIDPVNELIDRKPDDNVIRVQVR
jgi:aminopeptidase N